MCRTRRRLLTLLAEKLLIVSSRNAYPTSFYLRKCSVRAVISSQAGPRANKTCCNHKNDGSYNVIVCLLARAATISRAGPRALLQPTRYYLLASSSIGLTVTPMGHAVATISLPKKMGAPECICREP